MSCRIIGEVDDAAVVTACLFLVERDLLGVQAVERRWVTPYEIEASWNPLKSKGCSGSRPSESQIRRTALKILGIDVGGSGIKGAPVDTQAGRLLAVRLRIPTPDKAEPQPVAEVVDQIAKSFTLERPALGLASPRRSRTASP